MYRLQFRCQDGTTTSFDDQRVLRVGRGEDNDIFVDGPSVSRRHAELRPTDTGWDLYDTGSTGGTWVNNQRVAHVPLGAMTTVRFGAQSEGVEATITIDLPEAPAAEAPDDQETYVLSDQQPTYIYRGGQTPADRPGGGLLIRTRDGDKRVDADTVRIGRDNRSTIVADDPAVSRHHADVERRADGWWFVDHSNSGSYIDGERVKQKKITEQTVVQLGHPEAGYQVTLVPIADVASAQRAIAGKRRRRRVMRWAAAAAVVAVVGAGVTTAVLLSGNGAQQNTLSDVNLDRAKRASVQIIALGDDGLPEWKGSGTIIGSDGLILTNAHVAKPTAKGLSAADVPDKDPAVLEVAFAKDDNTPAAPKYRATTIVSDGYLDLAVMKIDANADGTPLGGANLTLPEPVPIGDSNALKSGDHITALGFPGLTSDEHVSGPLTVTSGDVSAFKRDYATNTERFWIDSTERIAHGNSGGASINTAGELIGVNSQVRKGSQNEPAASYLIRPVALAADIIRIARGGGDPNYVSPYLDRIQHLPAAATATSSGWDKGESVDCGSARDPNQLTHLGGVHDGDTVRANFKLSGIPDDTPVTWGFLDEHKKVLDSDQIVWSYGTSPRCIHPKLKIPTGATRIVALLIIGYRDDLKVTNEVAFD